MLFSLLLVALAAAHPGAHGGSYVPPKPTAPAPPASVIPATYPEVVVALREKATAVETAIDRFKITDVETAATAARDLATALPGKASVETQASVTATVTHLKAQLVDLVAKAEQGDMVAAKAALALVHTDIATLESTAN